jgi:trans-aconitate methyltransferase
VIPFASLAQHVTGADVSPSMLEEAGRNCESHGLGNVSLVATDDSLSSLTGSFDLIHSFIVFQHIPVERGRVIFSNLLARLKPGGIGAVHFSHSRRKYAVPDAAAVSAVPAVPEALEAPAQSPAPVATQAAVMPIAVTVRDTDPQMQMNLYDMNEVLSLMQQFTVTRFYAEFTDHGGELGIQLYFIKSEGASPVHTPARSGPQAQIA